MKFEIHESSVALVMGAGQLPAHWGLVVGGGCGRLLLDPSVESLMMGAVYLNPLLSMLFRRLEVLRFEVLAF